MPLDFKFQLERLGIFLIKWSCFCFCFCVECVNTDYPQKPVCASCHCHGKPSAAVNWAWNNKLEVSHQIIVYWHFLGIQIMIEILLWLHGKPHNRKDTFVSMGYTHCADSRLIVKTEIHFFPIHWSMKLELLLLLCENRPSVNNKRPKAPSGISICQPRFGQTRPKKLSRRKSGVNVVVMLYELTTASRWHFLT